MNPLQRKFVENNNEVTVKLKEREIEVLDGLRCGLSSQEIADKLFLSIRTIEGYRNKLLVKTGCRNTPELIAYAYENGIFASDIKMVGIEGVEVRLTNGRTINLKERK